MNAGDLAVVVGLAALPPFAYIVWQRPAWGIAAMILSVAAPWEFDIASPVSVTVWPIDVISVVVVAVVLARALTDDRWSIPPPLGALLAACVTASAAATVVAPDAVNSLGGFIRFSQVFVFVPLAAYLALRDVRDQRLLLVTLIVAGTVQSIVAIVQYATETGASFTPSGGETSEMRGIGTFDASEIMALPTIVTAALLAALALVLWDSGRARTLGLVALPLFAGGLLASLSRGSWVAAAAGVLVLLLMKSWRLTLAVTASAAAVLAVAAVALPSSNAVAERADSLFESVSDPDSSVRNRYGFWEASAEMWSERPVTGIGIRAFADYRDSRTSFDVDTTSDVSDPGEGFRRQELESPHSLYLQILSEQGILGIVAYGLLFAVMLVAAIQAVRNGPGSRYRPLEVAVVAWLASFLIRSIYADVGGPTVAFDGVLLGAAMSVAFGRESAPSPAPQPAAGIAHASP